MPNEYPDSGVMFRNDKKDPGSKQPDFKGELDVTCTHCGTSFKRSLAAWVREAKNGRKFFSLSFRPADPSRGKRPNADDLAQGTDINEAFGR